MYSDKYKCLHQRSYTWSCSHITPLRAAQLLYTSQSPTSVTSILKELASTHSTCQHKDNTSLAPTPWCIQGAKLMMMNTLQSSWWSITSSDVFVGVTLRPGYTLTPCTAGASLLSSSTHLPSGTTYTRLWKHMKSKQIWKRACIHKGKKEVTECIRQCHSHVGRVVFLQMQQMAGY